MGKVLVCGGDRLSIRVTDCFFYDGYMVAGFFTLKYLAQKMVH